MGMSEMEDAAAIPEPLQIQEELDHILRSRTFHLAQRSRAFLRYAVENSLRGNAPKEYAIAVDVLGRDEDYDPAIDATVRVEAGRLRGRLREYYDTEGKDDPIFIDMPKGGYSVVFEFRETHGAAPATVEAQRPPAEPVSDSKIAAREAEAGSLRGNIARVDRARRNRKTFWIAAAGLVAALVLLAMWRIPKRSHADAPIHSLAVLPLQNLSGDPGQDYFADGITDELITELAQIPNLRVVSRTSIMQDKGNTKSLQQIARELDVDAVVEGSVVRSGDRVRITAQLIDTRDDKHLWAKSFEEQISDILTLQDTIASEIASQAKARLVPGATSSRARIDPAAYEAYLRGRYFLNLRDANKSAVYFQEAVKLDPSSAPAYAGLAQALSQEMYTDPDKTMADTMQPAFAAAQRALELDPTSGEGYAARAFIEMNYELNWAAAGRDLERALSLSPNDSLAEIEYAIYLDIVGRTEEAVNHMRRALQLDPLSFWANRHLGSALYFARHYEESLYYLSRAGEMVREPAPVENWTSRDYEKLGRLDEAVRADLMSLGATFPKANLDPLRTAYGRGGWKAYQAARAHFLKPYARVQRNGGMAFELGLSYLRIGDPAQAVSWIDYAADQRSFWAFTMKIDPVLDDLRGDPHYSALLARVGQTP
jgi:TolB-like protein